jgi:CDP-diacylglycerol--serine O-phosphatidyltransferase
MSIKKYIPNFVTLLNLFCGSIAVLFAVNGNMKMTALFVFLGIFFDFFDGLLARKLNVQSELGVQLDSLADMVTSGLVPGIVMYKLLQQAIPIWRSDEIYSIVGFEYENPELYYFLPLFGILITLASAYRLAKFNISDNQSDAFIGLPTPANTLLIVSLPLIMEFQNNNTLNSIILNQWFLIGMTLLSCYLLNANIRLLALKFKNFSFSDNKFRYILIGLSVLLILGFHFTAIPLIIILYIILSVFNNVTSN